MNLWTMIFLVITVVMVAEVIKSYSKSQSKGSSRDTGQLQGLEERMQAVERRLENLETITTSKDYQLDREFEELSRRAD